MQKKKKKQGKPQKSIGSLHSGSFARFVKFSLPFKKQNVSGKPSECIMGVVYIRKTMQTSD